jgi:nicotinamidase-related amidase
MARFLAEAYIPGLESIDPTEAIERLQAAAEELTAAGLPVRHVRSIVVPSDETVFHVFESHSAQAVEEVGRRADNGFNRVTEALEPVRAE